MRGGQNMLMYLSGVFDNDFYHPQFYLLTRIWDSVDNGINVGFQTHLSRIRNSGSVA